MFPGHFNIPGHSGTSQKNKKAFSKIRSHLETTRFTYENKGVRPKLLPADRGGKRLPKWLASGLVVSLILLAAGALGGVGWLCWQVADSYIASSPKIQPSEPDRNAYRILTLSGNAHLCTYLDKSARGIYHRDHLLFAKAEYERALLVLPTDAWSVAQLDIIDGLEEQDWKE